jgi:hypothetical protein
MNSIVFHSGKRIRKYPRLLNTMSVYCKNIINVTTFHSTIHPLQKICAKQSEVSIGSLTNHIQHFCMAELAGNRDNYEA